MSVYGKLNCVIALVTFFDGVTAAHIGKLKRFQGNISGLAERRNRAIHDARTTVDDGSVHRLQITTKPPVYGLQPESVEELVALRDAIDREIKRFQEIYEEISAAIIAAESIVDGGGH
jgi:hypothetical protein